ncbi:peptidyl-prolyl isomerase cwc27 [Halteromyces radiatus]|uniref:peptidyl-prolyl isomerase cwc27 n=1 Tax=Halteromyces radiatus TaxID=101107 RepID=UPI00221F8C18|nr:peptidyl-prolyl isomerase cwc27 [Halteromyces radiatus]KAI8076833.1 peptidyl-prolyl isomerase cwc27 [Halteromyces radiatus]
MSNIYALEPHTNAKVILHTTKGDIEIELWGKEAPKATRNFIQLCMEGYYDNTIFHRIVPDFIVQGGDPTGTGHGGESIYEDEFPDEFHSRLRFNRRGLVGMANTGENDNGSQFFITLDRADELTKKHTLFGRVAGDTLFNVMKMTELELDNNNRPLYPPKIKTTEIVLNPFDDIIPRISEREKQIALQREREKLDAGKPKKVKKEKKKLNLLSFGEEAEELSPETPRKTKMKSSHDFMETSSTASSNDQQKSSTASPPIIESYKDTTVTGTSPSLKSTSSPSSTPKDISNKDNKTSSIEKKPKEVKRSKSVEEKPMTAKEKIEQLKNDIKNISRHEQNEDNRPKTKGKKVSLLQLEREKYQKAGKVIVGGLKGRKLKNDNGDDTFARLMAFQNKLSSAQETAPLAKKELAPCKLHGIPNCESCNDLTMEDTIEDDDPNNWLAHKLVFDKDLKGKDLLQRKETVDDYVVIDPRDRDAHTKQKPYEGSRHKYDEQARQDRERDNGKDRYSRGRDDKKRSADYHQDDRKRSRGRDDYYRSSSSSSSKRY